MDSQEQMDSPSHDEIAARAFEIYNREGGMHGKDSDHWFQAEQELRSNRQKNGQSSNPQILGSSNDSSSRGSGLAQPVTGEAAMNASKALSGDGNGNGKKSKSGGRSNKASRN
ncbi:MAG: DUF2934 domain-containing protein [Verrucomicrobiales bacterium]